MPHVKPASLTQPRAQSPRPARSERAEGASFESLLDGNAARATDRTKPPRQQPARAEAGERASETSKPQDKSAATAAAKSADNSIDAGPDDGKAAITPVVVSARPAAPEPPPAAQTAAIGFPADSAAVGHDTEQSATDAPAPVPALRPAEETDPHETVTAPAPAGAVPAADAVAAIVAPTAVTIPLPANPQAEAGTAGAPKTGEPAAGAPKTGATETATTETAPKPVAALPTAGKTDAKADAKVAGRAERKTESATAGPRAGTPAETERAVAQPVAGAAHDDAAPATSTADEKSDTQARGDTPARVLRPQGPDTVAAPQAGAHNAAPKSDPALTPHLTAPVQHASPPSAALAAAPAMPSAPQAAAVPLAGVAVEIVGKALAGKHHFEIRLDPPELGRIDVRLDVDRDGRVTSHLIADRRDTLDLLRRDSAGLERALQDAGLKTSDNGLQFSLRDRSADGQPERPHAGSARLVIEDDTLPLIDTTQSRFAARRGGIDIRI